MAGKKKMGARCSSACQSKNHRTFGECMRAKSLQVKPNLSNTGAVKAWDRELQGYRDAKAQGIRPDGTTAEKVEQAVRISNETGVAYGS